MLADPSIAGNRSTDILMWLLSGDANNPLKDENFRSHKSFLWKMVPLIVTVSKSFAGMET